MTYQKAVIGIRREDKNKWEKRVPLVPADVGTLVRDHGLKVIVQPSNNHRAYTDEDYVSSGAEISEDLSKCDIILGVKEIPETEFLPSKTYMFFSHVIKGQPYNMPMLQSLLDEKCTLIDYEKIEDVDGTRLIFFGRYAGMSGMVETLHSLGQRLDHEGISNPFSVVKQPRYYTSLAEMKKCIEKVGETIRDEGLPDELKPFVCGFTGYGNVSKGAQEIYDLLGVTTIDPELIRDDLSALKGESNTVYKVVFKEKNMFAPIEPGASFNLNHYFENPQLYRSRFKDFHDKLNVLVNCIYWTVECPRLLTKADTREIYKNSKSPRLKIIGDISCDIEGSIEVTVKDTNLDSPMYVYDVDSDTIKPGVIGNGPVIMAIENLPCELPIEASADFSGVLVEFIPGLAEADLEMSWDAIQLAQPIYDAVIAHRGQLTPSFEYINEFLK